MNDTDGIRPTAQRIAAYAAWAMLALIVASFLWMSPRGFGLADESFYLLNARQHDLPTYFSSFGWVLDGLLRLCGDRLWLARIVGAAILLGVTMMLAATFCRFLTMRLDLPLSRLDRQAVLATAGIAAFAYYREWIPTPSYNWLALCGTMIGGTALLRAKTSNRTDWRGTLFPAALLGVGGAMCCVGKVTSAAALALVAAAWLATSPRPRREFAIGLLAAAIATVLVLLQIELFEGGIHVLAARAETTVMLETLLDAGHTLPDRALEAIRETLHVPVLLARTTPITLAVAVLLLGVTFAPRPYRRTPGPSVLMLAFAALAALWLVEVTVFRRMAQLAEAWPALALIAIALALMMAARTGPALRWVASLRLLALLLALPLAYAFGSNTGIYNQAGTALPFYALALLLIVHLLRRRTALDAPIGIVAAAIGVYMSLVIGYAYAHPFRQPTGLLAQTHRICLLATPICANVDPATRDYTTGLQQSAIRAGWRPGMPLTVLTGRTPGAATLLSARTLGTPWLFSGFRGADAYALGALRLADPATLRQAWVLTAPDAPAALSPALLVRLGLPFPDGYRPVAQLTSPVSPRGQILWQPRTR